MAETAIVVPVPAAEPLVGEVRQRHTGSGGAGMPPHVTLLYPFVDTAKLTTGVVRRLRDVIAGFAPFNLTLFQTRHLEWTGETVLALDPEPSQPFVAITEALVAAFPDHLPYGGAFDEIVPHLTVAMSDDRARLADIVTHLGRFHIETAVEEAALFARTPDGWHPRTRFPLTRA